MAVVAGRRGARTAGKAAAGAKEKYTKEAAPAPNAANTNKPAAAAKSTGKTRSAGARRVAVGRAVANTFKKKVAVKKKETPGKDAPASKKAGKGFAPWNKNKFKKRD